MPRVYIQKENKLEAHQSETKVEIARMLAGRRISIGNMAKGNQSNAEARRTAVSSFNIQEH